MQNTNNKPVILLLLLAVILLAYIAFKPKEEISIPSTEQSTQVQNSIEVKKSTNETQTKTLIIDQKVATEFGSITIPRGWKAEPGYYKGSITSYAIVPNTERSAATGNYDNYVAIGGIQATCQQFPENQGYYCKEGKEGLPIMTKNTEFRWLVDSLYLELK